MAKNKITPAPAQPKNPWDWKLYRPLFKQGLSWTVAIVAVTAVLIVVDLSANARTYPRTFVGPVSVGYQPIEKAIVNLQRNFDQYLQTPINFSVGQSQAAVTPQELGIQFSAEHLMSTIPTMTFKKDNIFTLLPSLAQKHQFYPVASFDSDEALIAVEKKLHIDADRAQSAHFILNSKKDLEIVPEKSGRTINKQKFIEQLHQSIDYLQTTPIALELENETPTITASQLESQKDHFIASLKKPLKIAYNGQKWTIDFQKHLDAVRFEEATVAHVQAAGWDIPILLADTADLKKDGLITLNYTPSLALDADNLEEFLQTQIWSKVEKPTSNVKLSKDENDQVVIEGRGENGIQVARAQFLDGLTMGLNHSITAIQLPVHEEKAQVTVGPELQNLGIKDLIATGYTSYFGSPPNRMHNIEVGTKKYNGLIIKPGETFDFNSHLGEVDGANGFLMEKIIRENKIELEMGGGLCQVSTTAYRAALLAGLDITERAPHSWKVSYYSQVLGHGLDATIYPGVHNLKFTNNTEGHILMQAYTDGPRVYFKFYGTDDGRKVVLEGPHGSGLHYQWYRTIVKNDETTKEIINSNYKAIPPDQIAKPVPKPIADTKPATAKNG